MNKIEKNKKSLKMNSGRTESNNEALADERKKKEENLQIEVPQAPLTSESQSLSSSAPPSEAYSTCSEAPTHAALPEVNTSSEADNETQSSSDTIKRKLDMWDEEDSEMEDSSEEECQLRNWIVYGCPDSDSETYKPKKRTKKYTKKSRQVKPKKNQ